MYAGVELGGTKTVCVAGTGPEDLVLHERFATTTPGETLAAAVAAFRGVSVEARAISGIGVAAFGPIELRDGTPGYGRLTTTPKAGWAGVDVVTPLRDAFRVPVGLATDVTAAALAEQRWGAAQACRTFVYLTVGTGIGGGLIVDGRVPEGLGHPEMGHVRVPRIAGDDLPGVCPSHADCLEGLASGPALEARWGQRAETLAGGVAREALELEARYLAQAVANLVYAIAPERIVIGGGVSAMPGLHAAVRRHLAQLLAGYPGMPEHADDGFVVPPGLGPLAGALGALEVGRLAASDELSVA